MVNILLFKYNWYSEIEGYNILFDLIATNNLVTELRAIHSFIQIKVVSFYLF